MKSTYRRAPSKSQSPKLRLLRAKPIREDRDQQRDQRGSRRIRTEADRLGLDAERAAPLKTGLLVLTGATEFPSVISLIDRIADGTWPSGCTASFVPFEAA